MMMLRILLLVLAMIIVRCHGNHTWILQGALMPNSIKFAVKTDTVPEEDFRLVAIAENKFRNISFARKLVNTTVSFVGGDNNHESIFNISSVAKAFQMVLEDLEPNTLYSWSASGDVEGKFRTPPKTGTAFDFSFAFASCADNDSNHVLFSLIPENQNPLFFIHMGDLHYGNLHRDEFRDYSNMYDRTLTQSNQAILYNKLPLVYMWDDHDFGPNSKLVYTLSYSSGRKTITSSD